MKIKKQDRETSSRSCSILESALTLADSEHFRATRGTDALGRRLTVLHGYRLGILHLLFGPAFHAVRLHLVYLLVFFALRLYHP